MNADAEVNLFSWVLLSIVSTELCLNVLGALHGVNNGGKIYQEGIAHGLDDRAMMVNHCLLDKTIMDVQQPQHTSFIGAHLAAKAHDVGEHDRGQPSMLC